MRPRTRRCAERVLVGEGIELMDQPLGMNPAQAVGADLELPGIVAHDHGAGEQAMGLDAAPERPFGSDLDRIGRHVERCDGELLQMGLPRSLVGEALVRMVGQEPDDRPGERSAPHIVERLGVDHVVVVAGAQQFQKIEPALGAGRAEPGEVLVADVGAVPVGRLVPRAGVVDHDPGRRLQAGA